MPIGHDNEGECPTGSRSAPSVKRGVGVQFSPPPLSVVKKKITPKKL